MSLIPTVYRSTDAGAPVLNGQAGSLLAVLHAVLVTGYGSGPTAKPPAGWTRPFSSSGVHVYRNNPLTGSGAYLRVRDDASADMLNLPTLAQAIGYSSMSDIDTGLDRTPPVALHAQGSLIAKAPAVSTAARRWIVIATEIGFYLFTQWCGHVSNPNALGAYYYGDLLSAVPGDAYPFVMFGAGVLARYGGTTIASDDACSLFFSPSLGKAIPSSSDRVNGVLGGYVMRSYTAASGGPGRVATTGIDSLGARVGSYGSGAYRVGPDPAHGGYNYINALVREDSFAVRGQLPGVIAPLHARPYVDGATVNFIDGIGLGEWLAINYNVATPASPDADGQVLFRMDAPWK